MTTKKLGLRLVSLSLVLLMLIAAAGCGTTTPQQTTPSVASEPVKGGTLRIINNEGPQVVGYTPDQGPIDTAAALPAIEFIMQNSPQRTLEPFLAESVAEDSVTNTMTIKLRPGIMFTDGTELTAAVAAWNYQLLIDSGKLPNGKNVASIEVKDKYTLVLHITKMYAKNMMELDYGWVGMVSQDAIEKNGKMWARSNVVGTGPFKLEKFDRDVSINWVRNDNYWKKDGDSPYLERIEVKYIPDATTAAAMMQSGEADIWQNAPIKDQASAGDKGFIRQGGWAGFQYHLIPNTVDPNSKWIDIRLRQALDYAIDKPAIAKALGYGIAEPLDEVAPLGEWGNNPNYAGIRKYDPAKAKQLLAEAGYPAGLKIKMLAPMGPGGRNEAAEAIKGYLDAAGFQTDIDIADPGRYTSLKFKSGWQDVIFTSSALGLNYLIAATSWWSDTPKTKLASYKPTQPLIDLFHEALTKTSAADQKAYTEKIVNVMTDEALVIPIYHQISSLIIKPTVHTDYPKNGMAAWYFATSWIEKK